MRSSNALFFIILLTLSVAAQTTSPSSRNQKKPIAAKSLADEKADFEKALALADANERLAALQKFNEDFPKSKERTRAMELITSTRAALADEKMRGGDKDAGIELFKTAVREAPKPISDKLYTEVVLQIPTSLFFRGERNAAVEIAKLLEEKTDTNAKQTLALATYYLGTENAAEAKRLISKAITLEPSLPAAYQTLGMAHRLDFQLEESANAYAKALELDPNSNVSRRSLAEMKRSIGKASEAVALYREVLAKDEKDAAAQTGLILSLLDGENKAEAENELAKSLEANPNNLFLLVGAAYWYAAHEQGARAVELAEKAVALEPRYTWAHIALARGLMQQKRPLDAEKALLAARKYGDFPTLDYELATARFQAGFYREAVEELQKKFVVKDNSVSTKLGGRIAREAKTFTELLDAERRASIFQMLAADNAETSEKMKALLNFSQNLENADETLAASAADEFVKGDDKMKLHRQIFAADQLLQKRKALPKVLELTKSAISNVETGLETGNSTSAILADELYFSRRLAITRNELIVVPEVPRQTLSNVVRGRIEYISGWALFQDNKPAESVVRLKRAISVLPEKSSWWRNSMWRLGTAQESAGNSKEALEAFIKSYTDGTADPIKYGIIETVYQKVNGNLDGLELKIGTKPALTAASIPIVTQNRVEAPPKPQSTPEVKVETVANTTVETPKLAEEPKPTPTIVEESKTTLIEEPKPSPQPVLETPNVVATVKPEPSPVTETKTETPIVETKTDVTPVEEMKPKLESTPEVKPEALPTPETKTEPITEEKPVEVRKTEPDNIPSPNKSLFEPVIIKVPQVEPLKTPAPETKSEEKLTESEIKSVEPIQEKTPTEKVFITEGIATRPRKVTVENPAETIAPCKATVSQESISIIRNGGGLSLLINFEGERQNKEIKTSVSDSTAIEVAIEPGLDSQADGAIFVVKSISSKTGLFTVTFESECGKKELTVKVR